MSQRLDIIIFGASGFTGKWVVNHAIETLKDFKWGVAGRDEVSSIFYNIYFRTMNNVSQQ